MIVNSEIGVKDPNKKEKGTVRTHPTSPDVKHKIPYTIKNNPIRRIIDCFCSSSIE